MPGFQLQLLCTQSVSKVLLCRSWQDVTSADLHTQSKRASSLAYIFVCIEDFNMMAVLPYFCLVAHNVSLPLQLQTLR